MPWRESALQTFDNSFLCTLHEGMKLASFGIYTVLPIFFHGTYTSRHLFGCMQEDAHIVEESCLYYVIGKF